MAPPMAGLMDFSQFAGRLREKLTRFSGELCGHLGKTPPLAGKTPPPAGKTASRFVVEAVYGIISSRSVMLTEMGRCLEEDVREFPRNNQVISRFEIHLPTLKGFPSGWTATILDDPKYKHLNFILPQSVPRGFPRDKPCLFPVTVNHYLFNLFPQAS